MDTTIDAFFKHVYFSEHCTDARALHVSEGWSLLETLALDVSV